MPFGQNKAGYDSDHFGDFLYPFLGLYLNHGVFFERLSFGQWEASGGEQRIRGGGLGGNYLLIKSNYAAVNFTLGPADGAAV